MEHIPKHIFLFPCLIIFPLCCCKYCPSSGWIAGGDWDVICERMGIVGITLDLFYMCGLVSEATAVLSLQCS